MHNRYLVQIFHVQPLKQHSLKDLNIRLGPISANKYKKNFIDNTFYLTNGPKITKSDDAKCWLTMTWQKPDLEFFIEPTSFNAASENWPGSVAQVERVSKYSFTQGSFIHVGLNIF